MIPALRAHAMRLVEQCRIHLTFIDVGARNGSLELPDLAPAVEVIGFEPNQDEYQKLLSGATDHFLAHGYSSPRYRRLTYFPYALGNAAGRTTFYITPGPGACGMLEPNLDAVRDITWKGRAYQKNMAEDIFAGYRTVEVDIRTLDAVAREQALTHIDYLKIDVEGSEYEVLEGAQGILPATGVLRVEVCFVPLRKGQKLFSDLDVWLRQRGFELFRYEIDPVHIGYKVRTLPVEYIPGTRFTDPHGQALTGDAIYINRKIVDPVRRVAQALVLMERHYLDEALHLLKSSGLPVDPVLCELLRTVRNGGAGQRLRMIGYHAVDRFVDGSSGWLRRLGKRA